MKLPSALQITGALVLVLLAINFWIFIDRNEGYSYTLHYSYDALYRSPDKPVITNVQYNGGDSVIIFVHNTQKNKHSGEATNIQIPLKLKEGKHHYHPTAGTDTLDIGIFYIRSKTYKIHQRTQSSDVEVFYSNLPIGQYNTADINQWARVPATVNKQEIIASKALLNDSMKISECTTDIERYKRIALFLLKKLHRHKGIPSDSMNGMSPYQQLQYVMTGKSWLWCGNLSEILSFFCNTAGMPTRAIDLKGNIGNVLTSGHSFNEVYIKDLEQWVLVDLTPGLVLLQNAEGHYLNAADLYHLHGKNTKGLTVTMFRNDSLVNTDYREVGTFYDQCFFSGSKLLYYFSSQFNNNHYSRLNKLKRYLKRSPTVVQYGASIENDNRKFYIKQFVFIALICFVLLWMILKIQEQREKKIKL